jgi:hypothetical protein
MALRAIVHFTLCRAAAETRPSDPEIAVLWRTFTSSFKANYLLETTSHAWWNRRSLAGLNSKRRRQFPHLASGPSCSVDRHVVANKVVALLWGVEQWLRFAKQAR